MVTKKALGTSGVRPTAKEVKPGLNKISPMEVDQCVYRQMSKWVFAEDANCEIWISNKRCAITHGRKLPKKPDVAPLKCIFKKEKIFQICLN